MTMRICPLAGVSSTDCGVTSVHSSEEREALPSSSASDEPDASSPLSSESRVSGRAENGVAGDTGEATFCRALDLAGSCGGASGDPERAAGDVAVWGFSSGPGEGLATSLGLTRSAEAAVRVWSALATTAGVSSVAADREECC